jgi:transposase-like protein
MTFRNFIITQGALWASIYLLFHNYLWDSNDRKYLFAAIDRATRWVYIEIRADKTVKSASSFLENLTKKLSFTINKVLTGNGKEFTDRFYA